MTASELLALIADATADESPSEMATYWARTMLRLGASCPSLCRALAQELPEAVSEETLARDIAVWCAGQELAGVR